MTPLLTTGHHTVDGTPVGQAAYIAIVDKEVGLELTGEMGIVVGGLLGIVAIGSIELHTTLTTPLDGVIKQLSLTTGPENDTMTVGNDHLQRVDGKGALLPYLGITILNNRPIKIYCYNHIRL